MSEDIKVSVVCLTYNHKKYIRQCLDGFVNQQTNFKYEVIIHDDASTDGTQDIIREYEEKYPDIIKPVYQTENQYSKGIKKITIKYVYPKATGKYLAFCEGDDFWTDPLKLQKQFDCLETHPEANMCVHTVQAINEDGSLIYKTYPSSPFESKILLSNDFFKIALNEYAFQTSSYFLRKNEYEKYIVENPEFVQIAPTGDWPMQLYFGNSGSVAYINQAMSCYRLNASGSFTSTMSNNDFSKQLNYYNGLIDMIELFNVYSDRKYNTSCFDFINRINGYKYRLFVDSKNYQNVVNKKYYKYFKDESFKDKFSIIINAYFPRLAKKLFN